MCKQKNVKYLFGEELNAPSQKLYILLLDGWVVLERWRWNDQVKLKVLGWFSNITRRLRLWTIASMKATTWFLTMPLYRAFLNCLEKLAPRAFFIWFLCVSKKIRDHRQNQTNDDQCDAIGSQHHVSHQTDSNEHGNKLFLFFPIHKITKTNWTKDDADKNIERIKGHPWMLLLSR